MPCVAICESPPSQVQHAIECRHKLIVPERLLEDAVDLGQYRANRVVISDFGPQKCTKARHYQRCWDAFSGNVCYCDPKMPINDRNKIKVVAAYFVGWDVDSVQIQRFEFWRLRRQQAQLHLASNAQFLFDLPLLSELFVQHSLVNKDCGLACHYCRQFEDGFSENIRRSGELKGPHYTMSVGDKNREPGAARTAVFKVVADWLQPGQANGF